MQVQQISIEPIRSSDTGFVDSAFASYREGQQLKSIVVRADAQSVTLRLQNGSEVSASMQSDVPISVGDKLTLLLCAKSPQQVSLQTIAINGQDIRPQVSVLEYLLLNANMDCSAKNISFTQTLEQLSLPVHTTILYAMQQGLDQFPTLPPTLAAFMASQSVPITKNNIRILTAWLSGDTALHYLIQFASSGDSNDTSPSYPNVQTKIHTAEHTFFAPIVDTNDAPAFSPSFPGLQKEILLPGYEAKYPQKNATPQQHMPVTLSNIDAPVTAHFAQLSKLIHQIFPLLDTNVSNSETLRKAVLSLPECLEQLQRMTKHDASCAALSKCLDQLQEQGDLGTKFNSFCYAQIPFRINTHSRSANLYIMKKKGHTQIDDTQATVLLSLDTEYLGQIDSVLTIKNNFLSLQIRAGSKDSCEYIRSNIPLLKELLCSTSYQIETIFVTQTKTPLTPLTACQIAAVEHCLPSTGIDLSI